MENRILTHREHFPPSFKDDHEISSRQAREFMDKKGLGLRGRVVLRDEKGNIILEKDNLIVLRGRTFTLEKIFNDPITPTSGYIQDLNRQVVLFKIGNGGANIASSPFNPYTPSYNDQALASQVPFVIIDQNKNSDPVKQANPSILTSIGALSNMYYDAHIQPDGTTYYFAKVFDSSPSWFFSSSLNEVYKLIQMTVATTDARNQYINELGLFIAEWDAANSTYKNIEIFSRICFDTESLTNLTKQITVQYYIYA